MRLRLDNNRGFTLIEILVVLALTMLTMGLIFGPLVWSLRMTRSGEIMIRTQDNARFALAQVSKDLSDAMYVYDDNSEKDYVNFWVPDAAGVIDPDNPVHVYGSKVDLILPRMRGYCSVDASHTPGGITRDIDANPVCPYVDSTGKRCGAPLEWRPIQPLSQDTTIVRYFIGLEDPTQPYRNGFLMPLAEAGGDNTFVLYRAEFNLGDQAQREALFPATDDDGKALSVEGMRRYQNFFYNQNINPVTHIPYCQEWKKISRAIVTLEDVDLIQTTYDVAGQPVVTPLVKFAPTPIYNDPLVPTGDMKNTDAPPTMYKATYGNWVQPYKVTLTPEPGQGPFAAPAKLTYETKIEIDYAKTPPETVGMAIFRVQPALPDVLQFRIDDYLDSKAVSPYGAGVIAAGLGRERAFTVDAKRGTVNFAFPNVSVLNSTDILNKLGLPIGSRALSDLADADVVNAGTLLGVPGSYPINCPAHSGNPDRRILPYSTVVPGSVKIMAPDETKGNVTPVPLVAYTETPYMMREPGVNEFSVDIGYNTDLASLAYGTAALYFHRERDVNSAPLQQTSPGSAPLPRVGLPIGNVLIYYEVQNNRRGDVLRASYVTKSVMTVMLGVQIWDSGTKRPQIVQFTNKVRLKNIGS